MYLQELKTKNTQVDVDCFYQINIKTPHISDIDTLKIFLLVLDFSFLSFALKHYNNIRLDYGLQILAYHY